MSEAQLATMTPEEFLAWEERQDLKWEFDGFRPVAMTGGTYTHMAIGLNLTTALNLGLRGKRCRAASADPKVQIGRSYRYPDAFVFCAPIAPDALIAPEPVVIFEVLSPSTALEDRTTKMSEYLSLPSVQRYVMLEQERVFANMVVRAEWGWNMVQLGPDGTLDLPEIELRIPMADIYAGLELPSAAGL